MKRGLVLNSASFDRWGIWVPAAIFALVALGTVAQFLRSGDVPETPANDLAKHAALIVNFLSAFLDGQWLPRMQPLPVELPDIPTFQFYGSMLGFISMPFLAIGLPPLIALTLAVWVVRWLGALAIFATGRLMGANLWAGLLAGTSFLLTPYVLSNLYGRVAYPEAIAHGIIPILFYGLVRMAVRADATSAVTICLSIATLALAHPIFLMYGCAASGLFVLFAFRLRAVVPVALVLVGSLLIASFQWLPAFLLREDFAVSFFNLPTYRAFLTSASGLYGFPMSLAEHYPNDEAKWYEARLYLTPGILTVPVLLMMFAKLRDRFSIAVLLSAAVFLFLSFSPFDIWRFLPRFTWAVQFPYRLLAFVALFVALGICLTLKQLRMWQLALFGLMILIQSWGILLLPPYSSPLPTQQNAIPQTFASVDYCMTPLSPLTSHDRWLIASAIPIVADDLPQRKSMVDQQRYLLKDNVLENSGAKSGTRYLRMRGTTESEKVPISIWIAFQSNPNVPIGDVQTVGPGDFIVLFTIPNNPYSVTIRSTATLRADQPRGAVSPEATNIRVNLIEMLPGNVIQVPGYGARFLWLSGRTIFTEPVEIWLAHPASPEIPASEILSVGPGLFDRRLRLPKQPGEYTLAVSRYFVPALEDPRSTDHRRLGIEIWGHAQIADTDSVISLTERDYSDGYTREFRIERAGLTRRGDNDRVFVELSMAYSPLITVFQAGNRLGSKPSNGGLILVETRDLNTPIVARFRLPWLVWPATVLGFFLLILGTVMVRQPNSRSN